MTEILTEISDLHRDVLYPVVRVRAEGVGGSGTIIYSQAFDGNIWETLILTNHHVIEKAIEVKDRWEPYLRRNVKHEERRAVSVDRFLYEKESVNVSAETLQADIMAWDQDEDLALLKLRLKESGWPHVAKLLPLARESELRMFQLIRACGCSLLHPPFSTLGEITGLNDEIDNRRYFMGSSLITFGSSGGAVFTEPEHEFIGVPSRMSLQGWSDAANWMGYFIPPHRWYGFLEKNYFSFIWTSEDPNIYHERRERRQKRAESALEAIRQGVIEDQDLSGGQEEEPEGEAPSPD